MAKPKNWLREIVLGILGNALWQAILVGSPILAAVIYSFFRDDAAFAWLIALIVLVVINLLITFYLARQQVYLLRFWSDLFQNLQSASGIANQPPLRATPETAKQKKLRLDAEGEFEITDKQFNESTEPQTIYIRFTNRGSNIIRVEKIKYSSWGPGLSNSALLSSYRTEDGGRFVVIPFDPSDAEVLPGKTFTVELGLAQKWTNAHINRMAGEWGNLRIDVVYTGSPLELFYSI